MKEVKKLLKKAIREGLTTEEELRLCRLVGQWRVCAIGENRAALKRRGYKFDRDLQPMSARLRNFGGSFPQLVANKLFYTAFDLYARIENIARRPGRIGRPTV